jgi:hypothetical protein
MRHLGEFLGWLHARCGLGPEKPLGKGPKSRSGQLGSKLIRMDAIRRRGVDISWMRTGKRSACRASSLKIKHERFKHTEHRQVVFASQDFTEW